MKNKLNLLFAFIIGLIIGLFVVVISRELKNSDSNVTNLDSIHNIADPNSTEPMILDTEVDKNEITFNLLNTSKICIKSTVSEPNKKNICWKEVKDNKYSVSLYNNKTYYVWLMDEDANIYKNDAFINLKK